MRFPMVVAPATPGTGVLGLVEGPVPIVDVGSLKHISTSQVEIVRSFAPQLDTTEGYAKSTASATVTSSSTASCNWVSVKI